MYMHANGRECVSFLYCGFLADNVHFQNTAQLVTALTKAGVKYQVQVSEYFIKKY